MKLDSEFSTVNVCPKNGEFVADSDLHFTACCPRCGWSKSFSPGSSFTTPVGEHTNVVSGKWNRPSLVEWFQGKRKEFVPRDKLEVS